MIKNHKELESEREKESERARQKSIPFIEKQSIFSLSTGCSGRLSKPIRIFTLDAIRLNAVLERVEWSESIADLEPPRLRCGPR